MATGHHGVHVGARNPPLRERTVPRGCLVGEDPPLWPPPPGFFWSQGFSLCKGHAVVDVYTHLAPFNAANFSFGLPPEAINLTVWSSYPNATVEKSSFIGVWYTAWPSEYDVSQGGPLNVQAARTLQATNRAFTVWSGLWKGRPVDDYTAAVLAGQEFDFNKGGFQGGSASSGGNSPSPAAFSPSEVLTGFEPQMGEFFGRNQLVWAPGGGVENIGMVRAINEALLGSIGGVGGDAYLSLFPFWPRNESASFYNLLGKGGVAVSAEWSGLASAVLPPVVVTRIFGGSGGTVRLKTPWVELGGNVTVLCNGVGAPVQWDKKFQVLSWVALLHVPCEVNPSG